MDRIKCSRQKPAFQSGLQQLRPNGYRKTLSQLESKISMNKTNSVSHTPPGAKQQSTAAAKASKTLGPPSTTISWNGWQSSKLASKVVWVRLWMSAGLIAGLGQCFSQHKYVMHTGYSRRQYVSQFRHSVSPSFSLTWSLSTTTQLPQGSYKLFRIIHAWS